MQYRLQMQTIPMGKGYVSRDGNAYARGAQAVLFRKVDEGLQAEFPPMDRPLTGRLRGLSLFTAASLAVMDKMWILLTTWSRGPYRPSNGSEKAGTTGEGEDVSRKRCVLSLLLFRYVLVSPILGVYSRYVRYAIPFSPRLGHLGAVRSRRRSRPTGAHDEKWSKVSTICPMAVGQILSNMNTCPRGHKNPCRELHLEKKETRLGEEFIFKFFIHAPLRLPPEQTKFQNRIPQLSFADVSIFHRNVLLVLSGSYDSVRQLSDCRNAPGMP